jgi:hypothetical protein
MLCFHENVRRSNFFLCVDTMFTAGVFVTQVSSNAEISV